MMISAEFEPVFRRPAIEHQLQRAKTDAQCNESEPVEARRGIVTRLMQKEKHACCGHDADRDIDVKHPAPGIMVGEESAERRPQDRPQHDDHRPDRHDLPAFLQRIAVDDDGLRERRQRRAKRPLQQPEDDHLVEGLRQPAHRRGDRESDKAHEEYLAPAEPGGEPADRPGQNRGRDHIGCEHPGDLIARRLQASLHVRERHIGDRRIEHLHEHAEHHADDGNAKPQGRFAQCRRAQGVGDQWRNSADARRGNDTRAPLFSTGGRLRSM